MTGPFARHQLAIAFDSARGVSVLNGGQETFSGNLSEETREWDGAAWTEIANSPPGLFSPAMTYDPARDRIVLFGGTDFFVGMDDTWEFDALAWPDVLVAGPPPRFDHAMACDSARDAVVPLGGRPLGLLDPIIETWELLLAGDFDGDSDVDRWDSDNDGDADRSDFAIFVQNYTGAR